MIINAALALTALSRNSSLEKDATLVCKPSAAPHSKVGNEVGGCKSEDEVRE